LQTDGVQILRNNPPNMVLVCVTALPRKVMSLLLVLHNQDRQISEG